jgi:hypothetical protein
VGDVDGLGLGDEGADDGLDEKGVDFQREVDEVILALLEDFVSILGCGLVLVFRRRRCRTWYDLQVVRPERS